MSDAGSAWMLRRFHLKKVWMFSPESHWLYLTLNVWILEYPKLFQNQLQVNKAWSKLAAWKNDSLVTVALYPDQLWYVETWEHYAMTGYDMSRPGDLIPVVVSGPCHIVSELLLLRTHEFNMGDVCCREEGREGGKSYGHWMSLRKIYWFPST